MAIATISETIDRGKLSIGYAANDNAKGNLFGRRLNSNFVVSPVTIAMVTDALEWSSDGGAQTDAEEREIANYLIWLIGKYGMQAQVTLGDTSGGGSLTPGGSTTLASPIDWEVGATASGVAPLANNESSVTLDGTGGMPDLRGYNIEFTRASQVQNTTTASGIYYTWNRTTGLFTCTPAVVTGEVLRILPTK